MRLLSPSDRALMLNTITALLSDKSFCPFLFYPGFARVVSGTEEAASAWTSVNLFMGVDLFRSGFEYVQEQSDVTSYGIVDLSECSLQVAFYENNQSVLDSQYTLRYADQSIWGIYAASYLDLGYTSFKNLHERSLADSVSVPPDSAVVPQALDFCFHAGYTENMENSNGTLSVQIWGPAAPAGNQLWLCMATLKPLLLRLQARRACAVAYGDQQCAFDGSYQPPVTSAAVVGFVGMSAMQFTYTFLQLPSSATIDDWTAAASTICSKSFNDILLYYESNPSFIQIPDISRNLPYFCFISSYIITLLTGCTQYFSSSVTF